jgi:hypothetical protein
MTDHNRRAGQLPNGIRDIVDVVGDSRPAQFLPSLAASVSTQIDGMRGEPVLREVLENVHIPTPGSVEHSVDEEERREMSLLHRKFRDDFQFHDSLVRRRCRAKRVSLRLEPAVPQRRMER